MSVKDHYNVVGGPGDGKRVLRLALPNARQGEVQKIITPDHPYKALHYRLEGEDLHFVEDKEIVIFRGGPLDGEVNTLEHLEGQGIVDGENLVIKLGEGRVAWYERKGRELIFLSISAESGLVVIPSKESLTTEEPGLKIPDLPSGTLPDGNLEDTPWGTESDRPSTP